jgi:hypothetical protein
LPGQAHVELTAERQGGAAELPNGQHQTGNGCHGDQTEKDLEQRGHGCSPVGPGAGFSSAARRNAALRFEKRNTESRRRRLNDDPDLVLGHCIEFLFWCEPNFIFIFQH